MSVFGGLAGIAPVSFGGTVRDAFLNIGTRLNVAKGNANTLPVMISLMIMRPRCRIGRLMAIVLVMMTVAFLGLVTLRIVAAVGCVNVVA